jgi:hypothetical protein
VARRRQRRRAPHHQRRRPADPRSAPLRLEHRLLRRALKVNFLAKQRDEERYNTLEALTAQIARDAEQARAYFARIPSEFTAAHRPCPNRKTLNLPDSPSPCAATSPSANPMDRRLAAAQALPEDPQGSAGRPKFVLHDGPPYANGRCTSAMR